jgi:outer membrane protein assembly factor BamB
MICRARIVSLFLLALTVVLEARPADPAPTWKEISASVLEELERKGAKIDWPGKTAGVAVDPVSGAVFMVVPGQGIWKSTDQGGTFTRVDEGTIGGRCETSFSLAFDPAGERLACFMLDGKCGRTVDGGKTWVPFTGLGRNWDYAAVDWSGRDVENIFAARHETGGEVFLSSDGGKRWEKLFTDPEFERSGGLGIFDAETLVYTQRGKGIQRSTDAGKTWTRVSELEPSGRVVAVRKRAAYWLSPEGLLVSRDQGLTWTLQGTAVDASIGPYFDPANENRIAVAGAKGIFESADGGESWEHIAALPEGFVLPKGGWYSNVAWDPARGIYYASHMGRPTYKLNATRREDWPGFRGPTGQGRSRQTALPIEWGGPDRRNVVWEAPLVGNGHASPIVWGDRIFVCTARWADTIDSNEERAKVIPEHHVLCFDGADGKQIWDTVVQPGPWLRDDFRSGNVGGYAAPTPATDGERVYVVFGSSVIAALDLDGRLVWRKEIEPFTFDVTIGSSPVLFRDTVILLCAMAKADDSRLIAYDKSSGAIRWESRLPMTGFAHSTPLLIDIGEKPQLVVVASGMSESSRGVQSFDPANGTLLWWCRGAGDAASAAFGAGIVYSDSGRGGSGVAIDPSGSGDVSGSHVKWRIDQVPEGISSPVIVGERVYRLHRPNVLKCWRSTDGELLGAHRLEKLTSTWASPIADAAGRLYVASAGVSYVIRTDGDFEILAVNDLGDPSDASAAVYGDKLIFVGSRSVYCIGSK